VKRFALVLLFTACKGPETTPLPAAPRIDDAEVTRAETACEDYKKQVCAQGGDAAENCRLADSRIEAVKLQVRTLNAGGMSAMDRAVVLADLRRIAAGCIEDASRLRK
jgi:hypothetical protein